MATKSDARRLMRDKLASSGLTEEDAALEGMTLLAPKELSALSPKFPSVWALRLQYHDAKGKPRKGILRSRLLEQPKLPFGAVPEKELRYLQLPGTPPAAYLSRHVAWPEVFADVATTIVLTEGELKASKGCKAGFKVIGLGGVSSWKSNNRGWSLLPELEEVVWGGRDVVICFDSDALTKPAVSAACAGLVRELSRRGAVPRVAQLPALDRDNKTGLDDFLVRSSADALRVVFDEAKGDHLSRRLWEFNERFAFVLSPGVVFGDGPTLTRFDPAKFKTQIFVNEWASKSVPTAEGAKLQRVQVAKEWVEWDCRRQFATSTYRPGAGRIVDEIHYNEWPGWGVEPKEGDVSPWTELNDYLLDGAKPEERRYFEQWCMYPLAVPGAKLHAASGLWSHATGLGKSLIGQTLGKIYGENYSEIDQDDLESDHNWWAVNKQFVMIDDMTANDAPRKAGLLKKLITAEQLQVKIKFIPQYALPCVVNLYFTSNEPNAIRVESTDRRFFIHEVTSKKHSRKFYDRYHEWLRDGGPGALLYYAQHKFDLKGFEPTLEPPFTDAKREMVNAVKSELDLWLTELREDPAPRLKLGQVTYERDLFTPSEIIAMFEPHRKGRPVAANTMGLFMRKHFHQAAGGNPLRVNGAMERFYIVRNVDRWLSAPRKDLETHITEAREREGGGKGAKF